MEDSLQQSMYWLDLELAALWVEIYRSHPELDEIPRRREADRICQDRSIVLSLLSTAADWDLCVAAQRLARMTGN